MAPETVNEAKSYSSLLAGLQQLPNARISPYSRLPSWHPNTWPYIVPYALRDGAPGYPASTWPLYREQIASAPAASPYLIKDGKITPYINGLFGFGALKNRILRKHLMYNLTFRCCIIMFCANRYLTNVMSSLLLAQKSGCPAGYAEMFGDIPGWGTSLGSKVRATRQECAARCDQHINCLSFEHSNTEFLCNLNTIEEPSVGQFKDYAFCSKIRK